VIARLKSLLELLCGVLAGSALFGIMALTLVDVSGRKLASTSLPGSLELTELLMVVVIFAGLPLVSLRGEHVVFDSLDPLLGRTLRRAQTLVIDLVVAALLGAMAALMWDKAAQMAGFGDTTAQLHIPQAPFVALMGVLLALTALVHLLLAFAPAAHHHPGVDPDLGAP
jgi:TRAP-type C4-dicarboxylate transport system permease small subunit